MHRFVHLFPFCSVWISDKSVRIRMTGEAEIMRLIVKVSMNEIS
jgi:hypothetical protein